MSMRDQLEKKLYEFDCLLAEAVCRGEVTRGLFGSKIGGIFVGNDGSVVHHVCSPAVIKFLRGERVKELEEQVKHHREELAKAEEALARIKQLVD